MNLRGDLNGLVVKSTHRLTTSTNSLASIIFKIHNDYQNVYVYSTDIENFDEDGVFQLIPDILVDELHRIKSLQVEKFGNVSGPLYVNAERLKYSNNDAFVVTLSKEKIDVFPEDVIDEIEQRLRDCKYDFVTLLGHVVSLSQSDIERYRSYKFSVEVINQDTQFESIFSFFYYSLKDNKLPLNWNEFIPFIVEVQSHYNSVPYHNWRHATDATQFVYYFISMEPVSRMLSSIDKLALLLSVICHDLEHNGHTNDFHRKTNSDFAKESGPDLPPLENHHQKLAKILIQKYLHYTLDNITQEQKEYLFQLVTDIIFSTDMSRHKYFVDKINENIGKFDGSNEMRTLACQAIMKLADLSNTCRPFHDAIKMAKRLTDEWYIQGDDERKLGLPISRGMDRLNPIPLPKDQIGFYKFCTQQLLEADQKFFGCFEDIGAQFFSNLSTWEKMAAEL